MWSNVTFWFKIILVNFLLLIALIIGVEIFLGFKYSRSTAIGDLKFASHEQIKELYPEKYTVHRYLGYCPIPNYSMGKNRHNSLGFRGDEITQPKPDGVFRIICVGGSTTYTTDVEDYRQSYPYLLQEELRSRGISRCEVINAGVGSWSSWESLVNLQFRLLDLNPDLIIVYHSINDIHPRLVWPPSEYKGDNSGARVANSSIPKGFAELLIERSNILRTLAVKFDIKTPNIYLSQIDPHPETYYFYEFNTQLHEKTYPSGIFLEAPVSKMLKSNPPVYFKRNLECMVDVCKGRGIGIILSTFAFSPSFKEEFVSRPEYIDAFAENNALIKQVATEKEALLFDFANVFPPDSSLFTDGRHVNERGSKKKAELFADFVESYLDSSVSVAILPN